MTAFFFDSFWCHLHKYKAAFAFIVTGSKNGKPIFCHTGELSLDEFIDGARRDKWVMKMLQMDVNPGDWINERRRSANF